MGDTYAAQDMAREENWILEPFQKGQVATFMRHIKTGLDLAANHTQALLIFSGGQTRARAGPRTEALSYYQVAEKGLRWNAHPEISMRAMSEEYARDSFENVLFSLCRFRQVTGAYPAHVHVVSFEFKRARFVDVHRRALRYPRARFTFHGVDPTSGGMEGVAEGERAAMGPFGEDLYGCRGGLGRKRVKRNPFLRFHPYPQGCSEIAPLFAWCGRSVFRGDLPWDSIKNT